GSPRAGAAGLAAGAARNRWRSPRGVSDAERRGAPELAATDRAGRSRGDPGHRPVLLPLDLLPRAGPRLVRDRDRRAGFRDRRRRGASRRAAGTAAVSGTATRGNRRAAPPPPHPPLPPPN